MNIIYSIGHSLISTTNFIQKLKEYNIGVLVDVRTTPYSGRAKQFNREILQLALEKAGIEYVYKGKNLGGLGENIYFSETIDEIVALSDAKLVVLMCSEGDFKKCHRFTTLTPEFELRNKQVEHILWDNKQKTVQETLFN